MEGGAALMLGHTQVSGGVGLYAAAGILTAVEPCSRMVSSVVMVAPSGREGGRGRQASAPGSTS